MRELHKNSITCDSWEVVLWLIEMIGVLRVEWQIGSFLNIFFAGAVYSVEY